MIDCSFSEVDLGRLGKPFTSHCSVTEIDSTQIYCHDHGTLVWMTDPSENVIKAVGLTPEQHTHSTVNAIMESVHWPQRNKPVTFRTAGPDFDSFCVLHQESYYLELA